jgi:hypothetical protein
VEAGALAGVKIDAAILISRGENVAIRAPFGNYNKLTL